MKLNSKTSWLEGGPYLEVSFLLENKSNRITFIKEILDKLKNIPYKYQIKANNLKKEIDKFSEGYPYDENDPNTYQIHSVEIPLTINISKERKSKLYFEEVSENTIQINFCFLCDTNKSKEDKKEDKDILAYTKFLSSLYEIFKFPIGVISVENDCVTLFYDSDKAWPHEDFKISNIDLPQIVKSINNSYIYVLLIDSDYFPMIIANNSEDFNFPAPSFCNLSPGLSYLGESKIPIIINNIKE
ncbi:hypothetical protein CL617_02965 [archaeon]|nr:hypothetical protein [archaeon]|tara:strand:+ start:8855 stop:9583 length:729 start_codon:yes stop_codon:yes gene_type:complete